MIPGRLRRSMTKLVGAIAYFACQWGGQRYTCYEAVVVGKKAHLGMKQCQIKLAALPLFSYTWLKASLVSWLIS